MYKGKKSMVQTDFSALFDRSAGKGHDVRSLRLQQAHFMASRKLLWDGLPLRGNWATTPPLVPIPPRRLFKFFFITIISFLLSKASNFFSEDRKK